MSRQLTAAMVTLLVSLLLSGCGQEQQPEATISPLAAQSQNPVERGQYLARAGDCTACHTPVGEPEFSGGKAVPTPFGKIYSSNLTSDKRTGLGAWTADDFWQAMHHGKSRDGRSLYPAFPYTSYSLMTRDDTDALFAYLKTIPAVEQAPPEHGLSFPYDTQLALNIWRALFFRPETFKQDDKQTESWNRGAYLVQGLGHCAACHTPRGALGNTKSDLNLSGAYVEGLGWEALSLSRGILAHSEKEELMDLLQSGVNQRDVMSGPMAEVVLHSLQFLDREDLGAMTDYLSTLPEMSNSISRQSGASESYTQDLRADGELIYTEHCADCHGSDGQGEPYVYPALAGNRGVTAASPTNAIRMLISGGFGASTEQRPRPHGMPSFAHQFSDNESAAVLSYIRGAWGNSASAVSPEAIRQN